MSFDIISWILANNYTTSSVDGLGALKGAPCTIKSTTETDEGTTIVFEWTGTSGATETTTAVIKNGENGTDGVGISKIEKINTVDLIDTYRITFTDNSTFDYEVKNGTSPTITAERNASDNGVDITITNPDGTTSTATAYDGKGSDIQCEVVDEILVFQNSTTTATVIDETLMI